MFGLAEILQGIIYFISLYYVVFWLIVFLEEKERPKGAAKAYPSVTLAIPAYNESKNILKTLRAVTALDYPRPKLSIIFIDDGSKDRTFSIAKRYFMPYRKEFRSLRVLHQQNSGKYAALNNALRYTDTEFFATLDADSIPKRDALKQILLMFESDVGAVSPVLKVYNPRTGLQVVQWFEYSVNHFYKSIISGLNSIHVTPGPLSVYRLSVIKEIGGFRDAHKTEDMEIAMRIQKAGYRIVQCNDAVVFTEAPYNLQQLYRQRHRWNYGTLKNLIDYRKMIFNKEYGDFGVFQLPIILMSGILAIAALGLIFNELYRQAAVLFRTLSLYDFNILDYLMNLRWDIIWLDLDVRSIVTAMVFLFISIGVIGLSLRLYKEKFQLSRSLYFVIYIFIYYLFIAMVWIGVFFNFIANRGTEWKK
jgi:cellulose synthase/poly-beta-1,6-N-acetylglucosamine synthase-like glycosyltransferase